MHRARVIFQLSNKVGNNERFASWLVNKPQVSDIYWSMLILSSWDAFFRNATAGAQPGTAYTAPPNLAPYNKNEVPLTSLVPAGAGMPSIAAGSPINEKIIDDHLAVQAIIRSYQVTNVPVLYKT
ncbi:hypothetical protein HF086_003799 [Spodoptera exigua]|uniref:Uncharacterized protein n=1 Tax=Spodoptera exigua TaxID=7107 RepID=A0A922SNL3_SPOEX|nr:hypothetical protein HF086_003799 [Spodoptera exigua]